MSRNLPTRLAHELALAALDGLVGGFRRIMRGALTVASVVAQTLIDMSKVYEHIGSAIVDVIGSRPNQIAQACRRASRQALIRYLALVRWVEQREHRRHARRYGFLICVRCGCWISPAEALLRPHCYADEEARVREASTRIEAQGAPAANMLAQMRHTPSSPDYLED